MVIAAHISAKNISGSPLFASILLLAQKNTTDRFIIFSEYDPLFTADNITRVKSSPEPHNIIFQQYWYSFTLPSLLKKYKVALFISDTGILSNRVQLPQFLFLSDDSFEFKKGRFFRKEFTKSLQRAEKIFTTEDFMTQLLTEKYKAPLEKIRTIYRGLPSLKEEQAATAEETKNQFTGGYDYFLFPADKSSAANAVLLLKAFSQLKKRLKSSMKLVVLLNDISAEELIADFKNYKYRDDVPMIPAGERNATELITHAYALIRLSTYTTNNEAFSALQNGVPVIAEENNINKSLFGNAAVYTILSEDALSEKIQLLYKDEFFKAGIVANAVVVLKKYDAEKAAELLYRSVTE